MAGFDPISLGLAPGDGRGDTPRDAGEKINAMLAELYARVSASPYVLRRWVASIGGTEVVADPAGVWDRNGIVGSTYAGMGRGGVAELAHNLIRFGDDHQPAMEQVTKHRGRTPGEFGRVLPNDRIKVRYVQAGTGGQSGHAGDERWNVDGPLRPGVTGEVPGLWAIATGTGEHFSSLTGYYGIAVALFANKRQQVGIPGRVFHRQRILGLRHPAGRVVDRLWGQPGTEESVDLGANWWIGPGGRNPGEAPVKFDYLNSTPMDVPEPGSMEVDDHGELYWTKADAVRRKVAMEGAAAPGRVATIYTDASGANLTYYQAAGAEKLAYAFSSFTDPGPITIRRFVRGADGRLGSPALVVNGVALATTGTITLAAGDVIFIRPGTDAIICTLTQVP